MARNYLDREERIAALAERYRVGEITETVFEASLHAQGMRNDDIRAIVSANQVHHRSSKPYRRGEA